MSHIPEIPESIISQSDSELGGRRSAADSSQARHRLHCYPSPSRPPPTALNNPTRFYLYTLDLLSSHSLPVMDNSSASAPASLRAERSDTQTPSPTVDRSREASVTRSTSATEVRLALPPVNPSGHSSSPIHSRSPSSLLAEDPAENRDREFERPPSLRPPVQIGTMNCKPSPFVVIDKM